MSRGPKIGNASSARLRTLNFLADVELMLGRRPKRVALFAEDFDALADDLPLWLREIECVRGPSVAEYR